MNWGFIANEESICGKCGMAKEESKGCCKDDHKQIKVQGEQKVANLFICEINSPLDLPLEPVRLHHISYADAFAINYPLSHAPPDKALTPIYIYNCLFRI